MRKGKIKRISKETQIEISLTIEGRGRYKVSTGIRFFDHMLELFAHHGGFDLTVKARGDLDVDQHHTVEDVGIVLGQAFDKALGTKRGILRAGYFLMPMDETMGMAAVDFCGRTAAVVETKVSTRLVGDLQSELVDDFFEGFARGARANVHARVLYGRSPPCPASHRSIVRSRPRCCRRQSRPPPASGSSHLVWPSNWRASLAGSRSEKPKSNRAARQRQSNREEFGTRGCRCR